MRMEEDTLLLLLPLSTTTTTTTTTTATAAAAAAATTTIYLAVGAEHLQTSLREDGGGYVGGVNGILPPQPPGDLSSGSLLSGSSK